MLFGLFVDTLDFLMDSSYARQTNERDKKMYGIFVYLYIGR